MSDADGKLLEDGRRALRDRIRPGPGPIIPDSVLKEACSLNFDDGAIAGKVAAGTFPKDVYDALVEDSDHDWHPEQMMLTLGEYIYRTQTEKEILEYLQTRATEEEEEWEGATLAEMVSALAFTIINEMMKESDNYNFKHIVDSMNHLEIGRLRSAASEVDLDTSGGKPALLLRLVEFMYSDVLLPPGPEEDAAQSLAEMAEEALVRSLDKINVKEYLQTVQALGRPIPPKLKSACLAIVRENYHEMFADNDFWPMFLSMIDEEKDGSWHMFIVDAADKGKKRKRGGSVDGGNDSTDSSGG